jgi:eukaryotic-like serine/threonine-protein kinase
MPKKRRLKRERRLPKQNSANAQDFREYVTKYGINGSFYAEAQNKLKILEARSKPTNSNAPAQPTGTSKDLNSPGSVKRNEAEPGTGPKAFPATNSLNTGAATPTARISVVKVPLSSFSFDTVLLDDHGKTLNRLSAQGWSFIEDLGGVKIEMVEIPQGTFTMGSPNFESQRNDNEGPLHLVSLQGFAISKYEITQAQWRAISQMKKIRIELNPDPSKFKGDNLPVDTVSWEEAVEFCERLSKATGRKYHLPSESEWEYAARAGTNTPFYLGGTISAEFVNYDGTFPYKSARKGIYRQRTTIVGSLGMPNRFGLFDMHGNVSEWCADLWFSNYAGAAADGAPADGVPADGAAREGGDNSVHHVVRGGNWFKQARDARSAARDHFPGDHRSYSVGFRVVTR